MSPSLFTNRSYFDALQLCGLRENPEPTDIDKLRPSFTLYASASDSIAVTFNVCLR